MTVILILLAAIVGVGALLYAEHRLHLFRNKGKEASEGQTPVAPTPDTEGEECCGMHITCEKDSLLAAVSEKIEYYDDEELDRYAGTDAAAYTDEAVEEFRDILLSMQPDDIAGWARSLQLRGIALPEAVRDELLMIVAETRQARTAHASISAI